MTALAWAGAAGNRPLTTRATVAGLALGFLGTVGAGVAAPGLLRVAVVLAGVSTFVAACLRSPQRVVVGVLLWLAMFGTLRRLLPAGLASETDPLLLVAPAVVAVLVVVAAGRGAFRDQSRLSGMVLLLCGLTVLATVNPLQGGIFVGAAGALFILVPLLWFWVGRALVDDALLHRVLRVVSWVALGAACYGLYQVYVGLPSWDQRWVDSKGYVSLFVTRTAIRPFASLSSSSEYVGLLAVGTVLWALRLRHAAKALPAGVAVAVLGWALTVASVRGALVIVPVTLGVVFAASRGLGVGRTALAGVAALFLLALVVGRIDPGSVGGDRTSALVARSVSGLSDPFNPEVSTLPVHIEAMFGGLGQAARNPVGNGVGVVTIAADRFGEGGNASTDVDPSNVAVAMGIPGLAAYSLIVLLGVRLAFHRARRVRGYLSLAALGILLATSLQWLNGGSYAVAPLPWLVLGWLDRRPRRATAGPPAVAAA